MVLCGSVCSALEQAELCGGLIFISWEMSAPPRPPPKKGLCHRAVVKSKEAEGGGPELGAA